MTSPQSDIHVTYSTGSVAPVVVGLLIMISGGFLLAGTVAHPGPGLLVALFLVAAGGVGTGVRRRTEIDRKARVARRLTTLFGVPVIDAPTPIGKGGYVAHRRERRGGKNKYNVYVVELAGVGGKPIEILAPRSSSEGRAQAEMLASFLGVDLHDQTSGQQVVRAAHELNMPLSERAAAAEIPAEPPDMLSVWETANGQFVVTLPPAGLRVTHFMMLGVGLFIIAGTAIAALIAGDPIIVLPAVFFVVVLFMIPVGGLMARALATDRLELSHSALTLTSTFLGMHRTRSIPVAELEELIAGSDLGQGTIECMARGDTTELRFGAGLDYEEQAYTVAMLTWALANQ